MPATYCDIISECFLSVLKNWIIQWYTVNIVIFLEISEKQENVAHREDVQAPHTNGW